MDKNKVLIIGGKEPELDLELIENEIVEAFIDAKAFSHPFVEVYYQPALSIGSVDGFIVLCVPSVHCDPSVFHSAVIRGLQSAYPALSLNERFSIVLQEQTKYEPHLQR